jgi:hypothetical protein
VDVDLRDQKPPVEYEVACDLSEEILSGVCFALSEIGVEGAGGGFIGKWGCSGAK